MAVRMVRVKGNGYRRGLVSDDVMERIGSESGF